MIITSEPGRDHARRRLPDPRPPGRRLRGGRRARRDAAATAAWSTPRAARSTRFAALLTICVVVHRGGVRCAPTSRSQLVADHSSTTTPTFYKLTAMWSSQEGSLLLWAWVLSLASVGGAVRDPQQAPRDRPLGDRGADGARRLLHRADAVRAPTRSRASSPVPAEGVGLNPLLRHPAMAIHPPMLYSGYVVFSIPFAFAIGALITRRLDASWIRATRRFALIAWTLPRRSASCSAPAGPTRSSAGAATGAGTRSRTRR